MIKYQSSYTGQQIDEAVGKALAAPDSNNILVKEITYTATPTTINDIIKNAQPNSTVVLTVDEASSNGSYEVLKLHGKNSFPENLTIVGSEGTTVAGVSITSGVLSSDIIKEGSSDITNAILPSGLTFKGVTFTNALSLRNARIDDLTIESCTFEGCNVYISPEGFVDSYGDDKGTGNSSTYRYPESQLKQKNLTISNCTFNNAEGYQNVAKTSVASGIHVLGVENVTLSGNNITGALDASENAKIHDGIQIGGSKSSPFYVWSYGEIKVTMNTITNCRSRAINIHSINVGDTIVAGNRCFNTNTEGKLSEADINEEAIIVRNSENVTTNWTINGSLGNDFNLGFGNAWEGRKIVVGDGITVSNLTSPVEHVENMLNYDELKNEVSRKLNNIADSEKYRCVIDTEAELEVWLEGIFNQMEDYSFRNLFILCKEVSDWPLMGTIHKRQIYATVDLTAQINGYHYIKIRNPSNGVNWMPINKKSIEQQINERAYKSDLDGKMNEGVLIYDGKNDTDETGLNDWLDNTVMPTMASDTIRNISVRVGGKNGDGKGIIPWPALGTIHKRTNAYATIDVTTQINGKHYTKYRTDGKWSAVACIEDKISLKADKSALDIKADKSELNGFASQTDLDAKMDSLPLVYNYWDEDGNVKPFESSVEDWLDNEVLPNMQNNEIKNISIECPVYTLDHGVGPMFGTICKNGDDAYLNLTSAECSNITKVKTNKKWNEFILSKEVFEDKVDSKPKEYISTTDTDETNLNTWLNNISSNIYNSRPWESAIDKNRTLFVSITTPAVAEGKTLIGTYYFGYNWDSSAEWPYFGILTLINSETGEQYSKILKGRTWQNTTKVEFSGVVMSDLVNKSMFSYDANSKTLSITM